MLETCAIKEELLGCLALSSFHCNELVVESDALVIANVLNKKDEDLSEVSNIARENMFMSSSQLGFVSSSFC